MNSSHFHFLNEEDIKDIQNKANESLGKWKKTNQIIRDDIFNILELETKCKVLYYPYDDDEICAFIIKRRGRFFAYINTQIPLEKQIFAAAHELYHLWYSKIEKWDLLHDMTIENQIENTGNLKLEEAKANRFAAEILIPKNLLMNELDTSGLKRGKLEIRDIVRLMDFFLVPYKTIVRRLHEIEFVSDKICDELLSIPDRDPNIGVMVWQKRLDLCSRNNERTKKKKLGNLVDRAVNAYEKNAITFERLEYLLNLAERTPKECGQESTVKKIPSEEEIIKMLEEDDCKRQLNHHLYNQCAS